jgi:hypothetical protein
LRLSNPTAEKARAGSRKYGSIIARDFVKGDRGQVKQTAWFCAAALALMTYVAVSESKPGFPIVSLLGNNAVQAHIAPFHIGHRGIPKLQAKTSPSILRLDDVESQEPIVFVIGNGGNTTYRLAASEFAEEKSFRIGGVEAFRVVQTRIPALTKARISLFFSLKRRSRKPAPQHEAPAFPEP